MNLDAIQTECIAAGAECYRDYDDEPAWKLLRISLNEFDILLWGSGVMTMLTNRDGAHINVLSGVEIKVMEIICRHAAESRVELKAA